MISVQFIVRIMITVLISELLQIWQNTKLNIELSHIHACINYKFKEECYKEAVNGLNPEVTVDKVFWSSEWEWSWSM